MGTEILLPIDTLIGNWKISSELGRGGQGVVWRARATTTRRSPSRALKACFSEDPADRARFEREISLLQRCKNAPNILQVVDSDPNWKERVADVPAFAFYVSELCSGSLEEQNKKLGDAGARLSLFREACEAVRYLHELEEPLIHRDIKPANFLIALEPRRLVLADFGIARPLDTDETVTQIQEVVGTQHFRAPEATSARVPTLRCDIYSLGRLLEWLLTGDVSTDLGTRPVPRGGKISDEACILLDTVIVKACQPIAENRYASVLELISSLPELWLSPKPRFENTIESPPQVITPKLALKIALELSKGDDRAGTREVETGLRRKYRDGIQQWRKENDPPSFADNKDTCIEAALSLVEKALPCFAFSLGSVLSQRINFVDQRRTMENLIAIEGWNWAGYTVVLNAPLAAGYFYNYLHGALCCELNRFDLALQLATMPLPHKDDSSKVSPLWKNRQLVGWPKTLAGDYTYAAGALQILFERFDVIAELFSERAEFLTALASYSLLLSLLDLGEGTVSIASMPKEHLRQQVMIDVPPVFIGMNTAYVAAAARRTVSNPSVVEMIAKASRVSPQALSNAWPNWKIILSRMVNRHFYEELPLGDLAT